MKKVLLTLAVMAAFAGAAIGAYAIWSIHSQTTNPGNSFTTGSAITGALTEAPTSVIWPAVVGAAPGTLSTIGALDLQNPNAATQAERVAMTSTNTSVPLGAAVRLRIVRLMNGTCATHYPTGLYNVAGDGTTTALSGTDVQLYEGFIGTALFGNPQNGADAGDLNFGIGTPSGTDAPMCFQTLLPMGASTALANLTNVTTFTFDAEPY